MTTYKTPDVYVKEISLLPPSVAEVATAIPAFIGYTHFHLKNGTQDVKLVPTEIDSMVEFQEIFGEAPPIDVDKVNIDLNNAVTGTKVKATYYMFDALRLFYRNGGGKCYIISIGSFEEKKTTSIGKKDFLDGLEKLKKQDEPTIILFPDALLLSGDGLYAVQQQALTQCNSLGDRVVLFDLKESKTGDINFGWKEGYKEFRNKVGINYLKYGAAYTPHLKANLTKTIKYKDIKGKLFRSGAAASLNKLTDEPEIIKTIDRLEKAQADSDVINSDDVAVIGSIARFRNTNNLVSLKAGYYDLLTAFKSAVNVELVKDAANMDPDPVRTAYLDLFQYIYNFTDDLIDLWAENSPVLFTLPDPADKADPDYLENFIDLLKRTTTESLATTLGELNGYNHNASAEIGATNWVDEEYNTATYSWDAAEWGTTFNTGSVVADNSIYNAAGVNAEEIQIKKMQVAEPFVTTIFEEINGQILILSAAALAYIDSYEKALSSQFPLYQNIVISAANSMTIVPPSGAIAGIYASVDRNRGVWKAPANVSLSSVNGLTEIIDNAEQEDLNVDVVAGKSINAIRPFTGKGLLVWGARTTAGNDNEWRYISVRRFYNTAEESIKKSTYWAVFEPNDANTWVKVKTMIENYLILKWREGALAGPTPETAFFVNVGLGITMTPLDILEGRMIVEIGMAVVRPAEFIILKFSHKMQEA
jgi:phage tail sheath protein FI